jgi:hypothetical protein
VSGLRNYFRKAGGVKDFLDQKTANKTPFYFNELQGALQEVSGQSTDSGRLRPQFRATQHVVCRK